MTKSNETANDLYNDHMECLREFETLTTEIANLRAELGDRIAVLSRRRNAARMRVARTKEYYEAALARERAEYEAAQARQLQPSRHSPLFADGQAGNE